MRLQQDWHPALVAARLGDLGPAEAAHAAEPASPPGDYFYARCLAESPALSGEAAGEAIALLRGAVAAQPANPLFLQTLALALARSGTPEGRGEAASLWKTHGLPHDLDLLGQSALAIELEMRPVAAGMPATELPWPDGLPRPEETALSPEERDIVSQLPASNRPPSDGDDSPPETPAEPAPLAPPPAEKKASGGAIRRLEAHLTRHEPLEAVRLALELTGQGQGGVELHLLAGLAAEEAGDPARARAHLARAARIDVTMMMVRSELGRVYWRLGWFDLALALWRSLPVEGPYDYGRHYHLALGHAAAGDRPAALAAMRVALGDFFYDVRHFYIKRAYERWLAQVTAAGAATAA